MAHKSFDQCAKMAHDFEFSIIVYSSSSSSSSEFTDEKREKARGGVNSDIEALP